MHQILIIDDNLLSCRVVQRILQTKNIDAPYAQSVNSLLGLRGKPSSLCSYSPDAILLDLNMPEMSGLEVLQKLRSRISTKSTPIIILTSDASEGNVLKSLSYGANGFLTKPVSPEKLYSELARVGINC